MAEQIYVYLEIGSKRTFASALDWPGWCRSGKDDISALQSLLDHAARYSAVIKPTKFRFPVPESSNQFKVIEKLEGGATTDFGAPEAIPSQDKRPMNEAELERSIELLRVYWSAFDKAMKKAIGRKLTVGPHGGGRDLAGIVDHVIGANGSYLRSMGWKPAYKEIAAHPMQLDQIRQDIVAGLTAAAHGELPAKGPRGGIRWTPRYFVRRSGWHVLDHAWEIEDRLHP